MSSRRSTQLTALVRSPTGMFSLILLALLVILAIVAPWIWGAAADQVNVPDLLQGGSSAHPLGTDNLGRDLLARVLVATRMSLVLALLATALSATLGVLLGALPTVLGRRGGRIVNSIIDFSVAFPALLLAIFLAVVFGVGAQSAVLAIGVASAPAFARLTRTLAASVAGSDYVAAAKVVGVRRWRLLVRHVLPNVAEPLILNTTVAIGYALIAISGLSFLGLGVQPPGYDWGRLLNEGLARIETAPRAALGPAVAIVLAGLAFNGLGEALAKAASGQALRPVATASVRAGAVVGDDRDAVEAPVLSVTGLTITFATPSGVVTPVRDVSLSVAAGEIVGIVGESGSGKSLTALALGQLAPPTAAVTARTMRFLGEDPRTLPDARRRRLLGTSLAMVFQDPTSSLNPALRIGGQLAEVVRVHGGIGRLAAARLAVDRLRSVRMSSPARRAGQYPHELSGGMRQRAMIAMGLMAQARLIIADEPTSALDVTVAQQILRLLRRVRDEQDAAVVFISHDMAVVAELCDRVLVMYAGRVVEVLDVATLRTAPAHPYTRALVAAVPDMAVDRDSPLATIEGRPPEPHEMIEGCAFAARCAFASARCGRLPELREHGAGHAVACWHPREAPLSSGPVRVGDAS